MNEYEKFSLAKTKKTDTRYNAAIFFLLDIYDYSDCFKRNASDDEILDGENKLFEIIIYNYYIKLFGSKKNNTKNKEWIKCTKS